MPIALHPACIERVKETLRQALPNILVDNNHFIKRSTTVDLLECDKALPTGGKSRNVRDELNDYIGEFPIYDFIYENISKELIEGQEYRIEHKSINLTSIDGYEDIDTLVNRLINQIISLPWSYKFSLNVSSGLIGSDDLLEDIIDFGDGVSISRITKDFEEKYPLLSNIPGRDLNVTYESGLGSFTSGLTWNSNGVCIQIDKSGFVGQYGKTSPVVSAEENIKSFFGLGIALRIFRFDNSYYPVPPKRYLYVHRQEVDGWQIDSKIDLDNDFSEAVAQLKFDTLEGYVTTNNKTKWLSHQFKQIRSCFMRSERSGPILLSCRWLFDSYTGRNELLSYVQATVALEILLGDKASSDLMGLGELLRNRCAYLIGQTNAERQLILDDFRVIYEIRCKIVHSGKSRLNYKEKDMFNKLRWMCARVIQKEVELLSKD